MLIHLPPWLELTYFGKKYFNIVQPVLITCMSIKILFCFRLLELWSPLNNQASKLVIMFSKVD